MFDGMENEEDSKRAVLGYRERNENKWYKRCTRGTGGAGAEFEFEMEGAGALVKVSTLIRDEEEIQVDDLV
jgi:hypothetical protein